MRDILQTLGVNKSYGDGKVRQMVLKDVSLTVREGEFAAIMGPSGSGKSTLLYCVSGMDSVDSGRVTFDGQEISGKADTCLAAIRLSDMGFIFQNIFLIKNLTVLDNVMLPALQKGGESKESVKFRAMGLLRKTGIEDLAKRDINEVSGGQLQRAGICRALINNPKMIFGDEPTGALNTIAGNEIMDILISINKERGGSILIVTHDVKVAARAERIICMLDGKIESEILLGKYDDSSLNQRESRLSEWLHARSV
ncbi:MAG TPA: ABC transporter ATP-binding protein [Ruminococcaceae bacterium]|nr:ABC transporter ATP-binding protein [Oscillospiraceae bacterium]